MADQVRQRKCLHCDIISDSYLCPEHEAEWQEKIKGYWIIDKIWFTVERRKHGFGVPYPYWFSGHYKTKQEGKQTFFWCSSAEALTDKQYDYSNAIVEAY